jgi:hypothetical protein
LRFRSPAGDQDSLGTVDREEQEILKPFKDEWGKLPQARQERLRRGADRMSRMTPEERKEAQERFQRWRDLSLNSA